jgi:ABC-type amino acid transport substrate-binding protein
VNLLVGLVAVIGYSAAPFAIADSSVNAAIVAGIFSTINVALQLWNARQNRRIMEQAKTNYALAAETGERVGVAVDVARESTEHLRDVKRKVGGERRAGERRHQPGRREDEP